MKKYIPLLIAAFAFLLFSGFLNEPAVFENTVVSDKIKEDTSLSVVTVDSLYSISIPHHLVPSTDLNEQASLQYCDTSAELYIIVIGEPKADFIRLLKDADVYDSTESIERAYREVQMESIAEATQIQTVPEIKKTMIGGCDGEIVDFTGKSEGIEDPIYYKFAFIDGNDNMYMVIAWTLAEYRAKNTGEMDLMLNSFRLQQVKK